MEKSDWERKMIEVRITQAEAVSVMLDRGLEILRDSEASYKLSDGVRLLRMASEIMEAIRPKSDMERSLEMLGMSDVAIKNGLVSTDRVQMLHEKFADLQKEFAAMDENLARRNPDTDDDPDF